MKQGIKRRGFASMDKERLRLIVTNAGITAHKLGRAHKWTSEEAQAAGRKGGAARTGKKYTIRIV